MFRKEYDNSNHNEILSLGCFKVSQSWWRTYELLNTPYIVALSDTGYWWYRKNETPSSYDNISFDEVLERVDDKTRDILLFNMEVWEVKD